MEVESTTDESHKKGRVRRKQMLNTILNQMHFYFSDSNLAKDRFLGQKLQESEFIELETFLKFNNIKKLTSSVEEIAKALRKSELLELNEDETKVKRKLPINIKQNEDECTIYVQTLQPDTNHEWLSNVFSEFGKVEYISIPKYAHNKLAKGFAFIEYQNEQEVKSVLDYFESIGLRIPTTIDAEELCSNKIQASEDKAKKEETGKDAKQKPDEHEEETVEESEKKRKLTEETEEKHEVKKLKIANQVEDKNDEVKDKSDKDEDGKDEDDKKKKKKSSKRKAQIKELGLQVLTKIEWKKLRNRYWEMQRKKMKQLKQHLNKRRLQQSNYLDIKNATKAQNTPSQTNDVEMTMETAEKKYEFIPGVIVKLKLTEPWTDAKKIKTELKSANSSIQYVEVPITLNSDEAYLRFPNAENAKEFCTSNTKGTGNVLENEEEKQYWEKIKLSRDARVKKEVKKQRGRDKLLKRAERELGKHIRFDDTDE